MKNKTIVIGVCSGIAAYKMVDFVHELRSAGNEVRVVMTDHAARMIDAAQFVKASRNPVHTTLFPDGFDYRSVLEKREVEHIGLADSADIVVIAPATANVLGKIAHGLADDFLTTMVMATRAPILVCPSMNVHMWENDAVQQNLQTLESRGMTVLHPDSGKLACGYEGVGRLAAPEKIRNEMQRLLSEKVRLRGKTVVVTAGGTSEPIDDVRIMTNRGSGKMGAAIARVCRQHGAEVILIRAKNAVSFPGVEEAVFETAEELEGLVKRYVTKADVLFHTAAVSDFSAKKTEGKIGSEKSIVLSLTPREKIIGKIKKWNPRVCLVGFKAEYRVSKEALVDRARETLVRSGASYIVANDVGKKGIGFAADDNEVYVVSPETQYHVSRRSKMDVARRIVARIFGHGSTTAS